jgi:hypothetical protein
MKQFSYKVAINQLGLGNEKLNEKINIAKIPSWVQGNDFIELFLPYLKIIGDSREQDNWVEKACSYYGICFETARKDKKQNTENLKEGDYTFKVIFGNKEYDYTGVVAYERKGSVAELYGNCTGQHKGKGTSDRDRIKREFSRFKERQYKKVVLMLEFGNKLTDLIGLQFEFRGEKGKWVIKNTYNTIYSAIMSWRQPNNKDFDILQSDTRQELFWLVLQDMYYYFRNEIRNECYEKNLIEQGGKND